jgi:SAM-dependent methyltransferase
MKHADHVDLLRDGVPAPAGNEPAGRGTWADLGSGAGAFTLALADLIGPAGTIFSVDRDARALSEQEAALQTRFADLDVRYVCADFTNPLDLPALDGVVMANALHFYRRKELIVEAVRKLLKPEGRLILVEYNVDRGNLWVPYPIPYAAWKLLAHRCGFGATRQIGAKPSRFLREIYSAISLA